MSALSFSVLDAGPEPYAASPTMSFRLRVEETTGSVVHAAVLRCQVRIEPQRRRYASGEEERLVELFGEPGRWSETLRPFLLAHAVTTLGRFAGSTEVELLVPFTYDLEVAAAKYLHALEGGEVPLLFLFSGTVFSHSEGGVAIEPVAWTAEAAYRMPVAVWHQLVDAYFPGEGWLRLRRETIDALGRFKASRALPTWEQAVEALLKEAGEP